MTNCLPVSETSALQKKYFGEKFWKSMLPALIIIPMLKALFFKQVQNKMHWAAHKHTAAEVIYERADAEKENMGLTLILLRYTPLTKNQCLCLSALL